MRYSIIRGIIFVIDRKRVAWPPPANANPIETTETRKCGYNNVSFGLPLQKEQPDAYYVLQQQKQEAYLSPKQQQDFFISQKQQEYNIIPQKGQQFHNRPEVLSLPLVQRQSPKVPPPPPPRVHRKPILRSSSDAQV